MASRDLLCLPINDEDRLLVTTDCSGSCGPLKYDTIQVPYEVLGYYAARVAVMELLSAGGSPIAYTVSNLTVNGYEAIHKGIQDLIRSVGLDSLPHISSSETNFEMVQSGVGISFIGKATRQSLKIQATNSSNETKFLVMGQPLVGDQVISRANEMIDMETFLKLLKDKRVIDILPVGSKGIEFEMAYFNVSLCQDQGIDVKASSGPSTCVIVSCMSDVLDALRSDYKNIANILEVK